MPMLRELQENFSRAIFTRDSGEIAGHILAHGLSGERRLQVYRNNTFLNFTDSLHTTYPVIHALVGDGFFRYAAAQYITQYPSTSGDLHEFGESFAEFLAVFEPAAKLAYLPDVARLEWIYERVFYAPEVPPLDTSALARTPPDRYEELKFRFNPAARLVTSVYPILRIWQVNQKDYRGDQTVDLGEGGIDLLIARNPRLDVYIQPLKKAEFLFLRTLAAGDTFATACEQALTAQPDFDIPACFQRHIAQNVLVDFFL